MCTPSPHTRVQNPSDQEPLRHTRAFPAVAPSVPRSAGHVEEQTPGKEEGQKGSWVLRAAGSGRAPLARRTRGDGHPQPARLTHQVRTPRSRWAPSWSGVPPSPAPRLSFLSTYCVPGSGIRKKNPVVRGVVWLFKQDRYQQGHSGVHSSRPRERVLAGDRTTPSSWVLRPSTLLTAPYLSLQVE